MPKFKIGGVWQTLSGEEAIDRLIGSRLNGLEVSRLDELVSSYAARVSQAGETTSAPSRGPSQKTSS